MSRHGDHDQIAAHALRICEDIRDPDVGPQWHYSELAEKCRMDPERMAQVVLCLAAWVPFEHAPSTLADRAQGVVDARAELLHWRTA